MSWTSNKAILSNSDIPDSQRMQILKYLRIFLVTVGAYVSCRVTKNRSNKTNEWSVYI